MGVERKWKGCPSLEFILGAHCAVKESRRVGKAFGLRFFFSRERTGHLGENSI